MIGIIGDAPRLADANQNVSIEDAARAFEALFLEKLLEFGNRPLPGVETPLGASSAERNYRQLFLQEVASRVAEGTGPPGAAKPVQSPLGFAAHIIRAQRRGDESDPR